MLTPDDVHHGRAHTQASLQKVRPVLPGAPTRAESAENIMPELTRKRPRRTRNVTYIAMRTAGEVRLPRGNV